MYWNVELSRSRKRSPKSSAAVVTASAGMVSRMSRLPACTSVYAVLMSGMTLISTVSALASSPPYSANLLSVMPRSWVNSVSAWNAPLPIGLLPKPSGSL